MHGSAESHAMKALLRCDMPAGRGASAGLPTPCPLKAAGFGRIGTMKLFADNGSATLTGGSASTLALAAAKRTWDVVTAPVRAYLQREAVYRELTELDDRMLSDIGLNRA